MQAYRQLKENVLYFRHLSSKHSWDKDLVVGVMQMEVFLLVAFNNLLKIGPLAGEVMHEHSISRLWVRLGSFGQPLNTPDPRINLV